MALIVIGIIVIVDLGRFSNYLSVSVMAPPILFIILGICIIATSMFGFYCINKQNFNLSILVGTYIGYINNRYIKLNK